MTRDAEMPSATTLPLFPLRTALMPGGALGLRIFETRYLDLVRDCARDGTGFGVCLIVDGAEVGAPAVPAEFGTEARIEDFDRTPDGLLALRVRGMRRFRVASTRTQANGLVIGEIEWREPDSDDELRPEHALLGIVLQRIFDQAGGEHADAPKARFEEAAWVSWRLAEMLPLTDAQRAALLAIDDAHARLERLLAEMP